MKPQPIIRGPVYPIPVPFKYNESVDLRALEYYCDYLVGQGACNLLLTVGTSRYNLLTRQEMMDINRCVAAFSSHEVCCIVSGPGPNTGSTMENIAFAQEAEKMGADGMLCVYPERWYGDDCLKSFFTNLADHSPVDIYIHAVPMRDGFGGVTAIKLFENSVLNDLLDHERIVGVKEENGKREIYEGLIAKHRQTSTIIGAGGAMRRHMGDAKLGAQCYLVGVESLRPSLGPAFFDAVHGGNIEDAEKIAKQNEDPYFPAAVEVGWHRALKGALSILGLMPSYERRPFPGLTEGEYAKLKKAIQTCGWID